MPAFLLVVVAACAGGSAETGTATSSTAVSSTVTPSTRQPATITSQNGSGSGACPPGLVAARIGSVASTDLTEISGAAASRTQPGVIWVHNDNGNDAAVYAVSSEGADLGRFPLANIRGRDWEDMALGPGPVDGRDYLYLADIGDNGATRADVVLYRFLEPDASAPGEISDLEELRITYPTGPADAETLIVDPVSGEIVIATKTLSGRARLLGIGADAPWGGLIEGVDLGVVSLGFLAVATGGDASERLVVIRTYDEAFVWERPAGTSLTEAVAAPPCRVVRIEEPQGEAIALLDDGRLLTISEGTNQPIYLFGPAQ